MRGATDVERGSQVVGMRIWASGEGMNGVGQGLARWGMAWCGWVWSGEAGLGVARWGVVGQGGVRYGQAN